MFGSHTVHNNWHMDVLNGNNTSSLQYKFSRIKLPINKKPGTSPGFIGLENKDELEGVTYVNTRLNHSVNGGCSRVDILAFNRFFINFC